MSLSDEDLSPIDNDAMAESLGKIRREMGSEEGEMGSECISTLAIDDKVRYAG